MAQAIGPIAQRLEQATHNRLVAGSIPAGPTSRLGSRGRNLKTEFHYLSRSVDSPTPAVIGAASVRIERRNGKPHRRVGATPSLKAIRPAKSTVFAHPGPRPFRHGPLSSGCRRNRRRRFETTRATGMGSPSLKRRVGWDWTVMLNCYTSVCRDSQCLELGADCMTQRTPFPSRSDGTEQAAQNDQK
jgi:hypothetical protein